jgi:hypothetical protein
MNMGNTPEVARTSMTRFVIMCFVAGVTRTFMTMSGINARLACGLMTRFVMMFFMAGVTHTVMAMGSCPCSTAGVTHTNMTMGCFPCSTAAMTRTIMAIGMLPLQHRWSDPNLGDAWYRILLPAP